MKKIISNYVYQSLFQMMKILLPIITIPIVSRALGPHGIGIYNYTNSIAQYFVLFAGLGIGVYGNREIARVRDDKTKLSKRFWEIFSMSFIFSIISLFAYIIIVSFLEDRTYYYLQVLVVIAATFDISWFFMGIEDFKKTSLSSLTAQLISFLLIILFVDGKEDIGIYIIIQGLNLICSQLIMWVFIKKYVFYQHVKLRDIKKHIVPAMQFFIPKIAIVLYTNLNKTLLGWLDTTVSVGYYTNAIVVNTVLITLITTLDSVLLPRMSNMVIKGKTKQIVDIMKKTIHLQLFFTIPMMFGLILITPNFIPWFFGTKFVLIIKLIPILAPLSIIIPLGMSVGGQYLVPLNRIKTYNLAVIGGAIVSIVINLLLIPSVGIYGAIIATLLAELFVTITRTTALLKETDFTFQFSLIAKWLSLGIMMYIITSFITKSMSATMLTTITQVCIGGIIYMLGSVILKVNPLIELYNKRNKKNKKATIVQ